jgi:hypothetical protein
MKPSEIIKEDAIKRGLDPTRALVTIQYILTHKLGFLLNKNKTVFLFIKLSPNQYECHIATKDTPLGLTSAMISIFKDLKKMKVEKMYGDADNDHIISLMKKIVKREGGEIGISDRKDYNWMIEL